MKREEEMKGGRKGEAVGREKEKINPPFALNDCAGEHFSRLIQLQIMKGNLLCECVTL